MSTMFTALARRSGSLALILAIFTLLARHTSGAAVSVPVSSLAFDPALTSGPSGSLPAVTTTASHAQDAASSGRSPTLTAGPSATSKAAIAEAIVLMWPNWTVVNPIEPTVPFGGGNGQSGVALTTADDGFGVQVFALNIYPETGAWDQSRNMTSVPGNDSALCTISASAKPAYMEGYVMLTYPPYFESVYDTPEPVADLQCRQVFGDLVQSSPTSSV